VKRWTYCSSKRYAFAASLDEQAHLVGPVEIPRVLELLVLAGAVEAHGFGHLDVVLDGFVGRRSQRALGPIALVEDHLDVDRAAVQRHAIAEDSDRAEAEVRLHAVEHLAAFAQFEGDVVQIRVVRAPQSRAADECRCRGSRALGRTHGRCYGAVLAANDGVKLEAVGRTRDHRFELHIAFDGRCDADTLEVAIACRFEPDGLPDASRARVEDAFGFRLPVLLAARDVAVGGRVLRTDYNDIGPGFSAPVMSKRNGTLPPSCSPSDRPFSHTCAR
jgi:hypothetical protein